MATRAVTDEQLQSIADAIKLKSGDDTPMSVADMALRIGLIEGGGSGRVNAEYGEYTPSSLSTVNNPNVIPHGLGAAPRMFALWQKDTSYDDIDNALKSLLVIFGEIVDFVVASGRRSVSSQTTWSTSTIVGKSTIVNVDDSNIIFKDYSYSDAKLQPGVTYSYISVK